MACKVIGNVPLTLTYGKASAEALAAVVEVQLAPDVAAIWAVHFILTADQAILLLGAIRDEAASVGFRLPDGCHGWFSLVEVKGMEDGGLSIVGAGKAAR